MLEYSIILTLPLSPSYSNSLLNISFTVISLIVGELYSVLITEKKGKEKCLYSAVALIFVSVILTLFMSDDKVDEK